VSDLNGMQADCPKVGHETCLFRMAVLAGEDYPVFTGILSIFYAGHLLIAR